MTPSPWAWSAEAPLLLWPPGARVPQLRGVFGRHLPPRSGLSATEPRKWPPLSSPSRVGPSAPACRGRVPSAALGAQRTLASPGRLVPAPSISPGGLLAAAGSGVPGVQLAERSQPHGWGDLCAIPGRRGWPVARGLGRWVLHFPTLPPLSSWGGGLASVGDEGGYGVSGGEGYGIHGAGDYGVHGAREGGLWGPRGRGRGDMVSVGQR